MHKLPLVLSLAALCSQPLVSQARPVAYPQDRVDGNQGNAAPFGQSANGQADECRVQIVIPENVLPTVASTLIGVALTFDGPATPASLGYSDLQIDVGEASTLQLSQTFAANYAGPATTCLSASATTITFAGRSWTPIAFTTPYSYGGSGPLLIDVRKRLSAASVNNPIALFHSVEWPRDVFLYRMQVALGPVGSGAFDAAVSAGGAVPLRIRLLFGDVPTTTINSPPVPPNFNTFGIGNPMTITAHGTANDAYVHFLDIDGRGLTSTPSNPLSFLVQGQSWIRYPTPSVLTLATGTVPLLGSTPLTFNLPNDMNLVGREWAVQSVYLSQLSGNLLWSNASRFHVKP